jgi:hypothetical protein
MLPTIVIVPVRTRPSMRHSMLKQFRSSWVMVASPL